MKHKSTVTPAALNFALLFIALLGAGCASSRPDLTDAAPVREAAFVQRSPAPAATKEAVKSPLPPPEGYVNDYAKALDAPTKQLLEEKVSRLKERARIEFAVVLVETTGETSIFDYSLAVARGWGIGPPAGEEGGGLLLLLAVKDRRWQIQVSRSLEADLPDDVLAEIGGRMKPSLRQGNYGEAVVNCVDDLIERLAERRSFKAE